MSDIYRDIILEHWKNPQNYGELKDATISENARNPYCGDSVKFFLKLKNNRIEDISFTGQGCAISRASASLFTEMVKGKTMEEVLLISEKEYLELLGVELGTVRIKCSLFVYKVLLTLLKRCIVNNIGT